MSFSPLLLYTNTRKDTFLQGHLILLCKISAKTVAKHPNVSWENIVNIVNSKLHKFYVRIYLFISVFSMRPLVYISLVTGKISVYKNILILTYLRFGIVIVGNTSTQTWWTKSEKHSTNYWFKWCEGSSGFMF